MVDSESNPYAVGWLLADSLVSFQRNVKETQARDFLVKFHANGAENDPLVEFQMEEMRFALEQEIVSQKVIDLSLICHSNGWFFRDTDRILGSTSLAAKATVTELLAEF